LKTLYYAPGACSLAPHIVLAWIGAPYNVKRVTLGSSDILAVNPAGAVPTLEDDGFVLTQAGAILHYLARKHPEAGLGGESTLKGEADIGRWSSFLTGDLHPSFYPVFMPDRYTIQTDSAALKATQEAGLGLVRKRLRILNDHMAGKDWILDRRSVIDAYSFPMIRWAITTLPEKLHDFPNLQALHDRVVADETVKFVLAVESDATG